jgi:hypothetical protein
MNILAFIYLSIRAFEGSKSIRSAILYFMFAYIAIGIYNIVAWVESFMMLGSSEINQPFKKIKGELYLDYYPIAYTKGKVHVTKEYYPEHDWVLTRGISQEDLNKVKQIPIVRRESPKIESTQSLARNGGQRTFTTINSDLRPSRQGDEGISMGSKISNERQKPGFGTKRSQTTNLTTDTTGKVRVYE